MGMIKRMLNDQRTSQMLRRLRGGPQSMLPMSPGKGSGIPNASGLTPAKPRGYVTPKQKPNWTPVRPIRKV